MGKGGLSKARLGRMRDTLAGYVERGALPGLVTAVSRRGKVRVEVLGKQSIDGPPMQRDTIVRISSMTKPITAVAALILVEECVLRLDESVDRFLPELADRTVLARIGSSLAETVPAQRPITLRDLLTFRLGFGMLMASPDKYPILRAANDLQIGMGPPNPAAAPAPDEWLRRLGTLPLMYQPGERWLYNTAADVLGVLIARASGQSLETFLRERIFGPLGMKDTAFSVPADKIDRLATGYWPDSETGALGLFDEAAGGQWSQPPAFESGGGGLVSTIDDYLAFAQMLLHHGKHNHARILSRLSVEAMTTDQLTPEQRVGANPFLDDNRGWGFGVSMLLRRDGIAAVPGRYGWEGGLGTSWANDPREGLIGIMLTQVALASPAATDLYSDFWTSAYQAISD